MAILDGSDQDLARLLSLITELSEQLTQNRSVSISLHSLTGNVKNQATHSQTGFVLRRFNLDKPAEVYNAELERMNAVLSAENQGLQHDNKQLVTLIKEYEQTLENVMSAFRTRARDVQEHELALIREYESRLLSRESEGATRDLAFSTAHSEALARLSNTLRLLMRSVQGEEPSGSKSASSNVPPSPDSAIEFETGEDWALERECELSRLERENIVLRRLLGQEVHDEMLMENSGAPNYKRTEIQRTASVMAQRKILGGAPGTVGPFGTYKRQPLRQ
ncbi:hypothetical protein BJ138DRAFT_1179992 [Hygrophoropsis aurantiaca]|uniref:Uncharacterized protein n=1 Tax=Hygrophoropsis aurantiaca TaxID=72124 RepID=A0ACB8ADE4_9AGAM|nr:hypothetical protein BJ138DRAFT_1179992 [Hygrophoropsis aurantiaca]